MSQQNQSHDTTSFQMEVEQRLPRFVLDEIFKAKEEEADWSSNKLKDRLQTILRRKEQIDCLQPKSSPARPPYSPNPGAHAHPSPSFDQPSVLLKCVRVTFFNPENETLSQSGVLLLDDGSTNSYISSQAAEAVKLTLTPTSICLGVFNSPDLIVKANAVQHLTQLTLFVPFTPELLDCRDLLPNLVTARPVILLGSDYYYELEPISTGRLPSGQHLTQTNLGLLIAGRAFPCPPNKKFTNEIEFAENRYQVKFPFINPPSTLSLPTNFGLCWGRLRKTRGPTHSVPRLEVCHNRGY
uniref:Uncharacterized protein n=1 Tax=Globodera rostochiensis TaxID=31243 RepID=A0A914GY19_GLORO